MSPLRNLSAAGAGSGLRLAASIVAVVLACLCGAAEAKGTSSSHGTTHYSTSHAHSSSHSASGSHTHRNERKLGTRGPPRLARQDRPRSEATTERLQEAASMSIDREDLRFVPRLRRRPRHAVEARRSGRPQQHAMADEGRGEAEGSMGVIHSMAPAGGHTGAIQRANRPATKQIGAKGQVRGAVGIAGRTFRTDTCRALRRRGGADET